MNNVVLVGRTTKEVDLKYTPSGTAVGQFTIAVTRPFKNKQTNEYESDFINCVIWQKPAETFANYVRKGHQVSVQGRLQTRNYEKDGNRVYVTELVVENFTFLSNGQNNAPQANNNNSYTNTQTNHQNSNRTQNNANYGYNSNDDPFLKGGTSIDISDDSLPF